MNSPTIFVMDELVMKVMIFAQFHESLWSHAHSFYHYDMKFILQKMNMRFNQRMILEWFEAIQAHRCQTFQVLVSELRVSVSYMYCVHMRPCARFSGGKRQFPDGQHHKKPPRLTTARLWLHFPKETALPSCPQYLLTVFSWLGKDILSCWYLCSRFGLQSKRIVDT